MRSPEEIRQSLARSVLLVRGGKATSRRDLASQLGISPTTAGLYAEELLSRSILEETGLEQGGAGRPKRRLQTASSAGWFAGIEFHAERLRLVAVDFSGRRVAGTRRPIADGTGAAALLATLAGSVEELSSTSAGPLLGIGVGVPGIVDPPRGAAVTYAFLPGWSGVPVAETLVKRFSVPVTLENNLRAIALAERWFGGAQDLDDYVVLGPRSGFGVAAVQGGELMRGARHAAGEIGYWPWTDAAGSGRLHDRLSSPAVWRRLAGKGPRARLPADLHEALRGFAEAEGPARREIVEDFARAVAMLQWLLDPAVLFLHGPLTALGPAFCDDVSAAAAAMAPSDWNAAPDLRPSTLDDEAGALGAASLAMERWQPEI